MNGDRRDLSPTRVGAIDNPRINIRKRSFCTPGTDAMNKVKYLQLEKENRT